MGVFCDRLKLGSTATLNCWTRLAKTKVDIAKKSSYYSTPLIRITVVRSYDCTMVRRKESRCPRFKLQTQIKATKSLFGCKRHQRIPIKTLQNVLQNDNHFLA